MCLVDITYFKECSCVVVGFSRPQTPMVSAINLPTPIDTPCGLPVVVSRFRLACDYSGFFCPQRHFYSSFFLDRHNGDCRGYTKLGPQMTVSGLHMAFLWFKGFLALDYGIKTAGERGAYFYEEDERVLLSSYRPLRMFPEEPDNYSNPQLYREFMRPLQLLHPYQGDCSWMSSMYVLLGCMGYEIQDVLPRADMYDNVVKKKKKYIEAMDHMDYYMRAELSTVAVYVMIHQKRQLRLRDAAGFLNLTNVWDPKSDFCNNCTQNQWYHPSHPVTINLAPVASHYRHYATTENLSPALHKIPNGWSTRFIQRPPGDRRIMYDRDTDSDAAPTTSDSSDNDWDRDEPIVTWPHAPPPTLVPEPEDSSSTTLVADPENYSTSTATSGRYSNAYDSDPNLSDPSVAMEIEETQEAAGFQWEEEEEEEEEDDSESLEVEETQQPDARVFEEVAGEEGEGDEGNETQFPEDTSDVDYELKGFQKQFSQFRREEQEIEEPEEERFGVGVRSSRELNEWTQTSETHLEVELVGKKVGKKVAGWVSGGSMGEEVMVSRWETESTSPHWMNGAYDAVDKKRGLDMMIPVETILLNPPRRQSRTSTLEMDQPVRIRRRGVEDRPLKRVRWTEPFPVDRPSKHDTEPTEYVDVELYISSSGLRRGPGEQYNSRVLQ